MDDEITEAVNHKVAENVEAVAVTAAAQVDQANRDAEAIARAAVASEHNARLEAMKAEQEAWRASMEQRLTETQEATRAAVEASRQSILEAISRPPQPQPIVEPVLESATVEPENNSRPTDTTKEKTSSPESQAPRRERRAL